MRARRMALAMAIMLASASGACVAILGLDPLSEGPAEAGVPDVQSPDADAGDAETGRACDPNALEVPTGLPTAPPVTGGGQSVLFAFTTLDLGIEGIKSGLDLDLATTTAPRANSCVLPEAPADITGRAVDGDGGLDNGAFHLLAGITSLVAAFAPERIDLRLRDNLYGVLVRIEGWNGERDDGDVRVSIIPTIGTWTPGPDDAGLVSGPAGPMGPNDLHMPDRRFLAGTVGSTILTQSAWVRDGKLVAHFDELVVPIRSSVDEIRSFDITLRNAWFSATLEPAAPDAGPDAGPSGLSRGVFGGRLDPSDFIREVSLIFIEETRSYLCAGAAAGAGSFCEARDIRVESCHAPSAPCSAVSFGGAFLARRIEGFGPYVQRVDADYRDPATGRLPPQERCPGNPNGVGALCP